MSTPIIHKPLHKGLQKFRELLVKIQEFDASNTSRPFNLTKEQDGAADECIEILGKALPDPDGWSESDIEALIKTAIMSAVLGTSRTAKQRLNDAITVLGEELSKALELWEVHQPISGLGHEGLPVDFGRVRFYWGDEKTCRALRASEKRVMRGSPDTSRNKKNLNTHLAKEIEDNVRNNAFCRVIVAARSEKSAFARALRELSLSIDVANLFANINLSIGNGGRLYLPGEAHPTTGFSLTLKLDSSPVKRNQGIAQNSPQISVSSYLAGPFSDFSMSASAIAELKNFGWERASQILKRKEADRTEMENRVLASMRWAGRATATELRDEDKGSIYLVTEQAFLLYAIAMESLLLKKQSELSYRLSLRGAHLLGSTAKERQAMQKELGDLYNVRSDIVHSGSSSVTPNQLKRLRSYAKHAIFALLVRRPFRSMKTEKEFQQWFDNRLSR